MEVGDLCVARWLEGSYGMGDVRLGMCRREIALKAQLPLQDYIAFRLEAET